MYSANSNISRGVMKKQVNVDSTEAVNANTSEEERIKAMIAQSSQQYDPCNYVERRRMRGRLPITHARYKRSNPMVWIKEGYRRRLALTRARYKWSKPIVSIEKCPTNNPGVKRSIMVPADGPGHKGTLLTSTGDCAVPLIDHPAHKEVKKEKPQFVPQDEPVAEPKAQIPEELFCMICKDLLQDAVMIPCCGNSFCDECVRQVLLESDNHECPECHETDVSPNTLLPNRFLRTAVLNFKNETGYTRVKKIALVKSSPADIENVKSLQPPPDSIVENQPKHANSSPLEIEELTVKEETVSVKSEIPPTSEEQAESVPANIDGDTPEPIIRPTFLPIKLNLRRRLGKDTEDMQLGTPLVAADGPEYRGTLLTSYGDYANPLIDCQAHKEIRKEKPPFVPQGERVAEPKSQIPEEIFCIICKDLLQDAVCIPCCGYSFCDECVRQALLESDNHECPECHETDTSPNTLVPNRALRKAVMNFKNMTGYTRVKKFALVKSFPTQHFIHPVKPLRVVEHYPIEGQPKYTPSYNRMYPTYDTYQNPMYDRKQRPPRYEKRQEYQKDYPRQYTEATTHRIPVCIGDRSRDYKNGYRQAREPRKEKLREMPQIPVQKTLRIVHTKESVEDSSSMKKYEEIPRNTNASKRTSSCDRRGINYGNRRIERDRDVRYNDELFKEERRYRFADYKYISNPREFVSHDRNMPDKRRPVMEAPPQTHVRHCDRDNVQLERSGRIVKRQKSGSRIYDSPKSLNAYKNCVRSRTEHVEEPNYQRSTRDHSHSEGSENKARRKYSSIKPPEKHGNDFGRIRKVKRDFHEYSKFESDYEAFSDVEERESRLKRKSASPEVSRKITRLERMPIESSGRDFQTHDKSSIARTASSSANCESNLSDYDDLKGSKSKGSETEHKRKHKTSKHKKH